MQGVVQLGDVAFAAIHRQRVSRQIIGADREEVGLQRKSVGGQSRTGGFDHDPQRRQPFRQALTAAAQAAGNAFVDFTGFADLADRGDHG